MTAQVQLVPFYGDQIEAVKDEAGKVHVGLRRCCASIGIAFSVQLRKLRQKSWASVTEMVTQAQGDCQQRLYTMISLDSLPMWLATIDEKKVLPHVRDKLIRYQKEAAAVLARHFFPKSLPEPVKTIDPVPLYPPPPAVTGAVFAELCKKVEIAMRTRSECAERENDLMDFIMRNFPDMNVRQLVTAANDIVRLTAASSPKQLDFIW